MWHRGSPEADGHLLVMPVKAELSQQGKTVRMPRFEMGHCAPKTAAVNAASDVCGACAPDFAPEIWNLQGDCCLCFSSYQGAVMAQSFLLIPIRLGGVALISFQIQSSLFFSLESTLQFCTGSVPSVLPEKKPECRAALPHGLHSPPS